MKIMPLIVNIEGISNFSEDEKKMSPQKLVSELTKNIILSCAHQRGGLSEMDRKKFYKICDALDAAVLAGKESVELDDDWMALIRDSKLNSKLIPNEFLRRVEVLIDSVENR